VIPVGAMKSLAANTKPVVSATHWWTPPQRLVREEVETRSAAHVGHRRSVSATSGTRQRFSPIVWPEKTEAAVRAQSSVGRATSARKKEMQNSVQQVRNLLGAFAIEGKPPSGSVLLVDDVVDSGWTLTLLAVMFAATRQRTGLPICAGPKPRRAEAEVWSSAFRRPGLGFERQCESEDRLKAELQTCERA